MGRREETDEQDPRKRVRVRRRGDLRTDRVAAVVTLLLAAALVYLIVTS